METRTIKLPKALINMPRLMMLMFIDVRGLFQLILFVGDAIDHVHVLSLE